MRLVLPTGPDGADRDYPADGLVAWATMAECQALLKHTGMSQDFVIAQLVRASDKDAPKVTEDPDLLHANMGMVWLARYHAGERAENGSPFTLEQACDFPIRKLRWAVDPGDLPAKVDEDPRTPPEDGGPGTAGGSKRTGKTKPRSGSASRGKRS